MNTKFWPQSQGIPVSVCNHRFGAVMTFSEQTDSRFETSIYAGELFGFKNNFRMGAFISQYGIQYNAGLYEQEQTGVIRNDTYYFTDMWKNPATNALEVIPDYYATAWTALGVAAFAAYGAVLGAAKTARTPNHGQSLFDFTGGALGYDFVNDVPGSNGWNEFKGIVDAQQDWFMSKLNRLPSSASYRNGVTNCAGLMYPYFIAARNSGNGPISTFGNAETWYGGALGNKTGTKTLREYFNNYANTTRWWDFWSNQGYTRLQADNYAVQEINKTLLNGGWYHDFIHWHSARDAGTISEIDDFLALARSTFGSNFVHTCSNGEALEYMFLRESCQRAIAIEKDQTVTVLADVIPKFDGLTIDGIQAPDIFTEYNIPLSVQVDLSGTYLSGKNVISSYKKLRSLGSDVYIVELPLRSKKENIISVVLSEGTGGVYNEARPTATTNTLGNQLLVTCDVPCKAVLFSVTTGGSDYDSKVEVRVNTFKDEHQFTIEPGKDYRIGLISDFNQMSLHTV